LIFSRVGSFPQSKFWSLVSELSQNPTLEAQRWIASGLTVIRKQSIAFDKRDFEEAKRLYRSGAVQ
jgi:hypothetical protein